MVQKYIIGLGCSWTQGQGAYPDDVWKTYNGKMGSHLLGQPDFHLRKYEHENSWVNLLSKNYLDDHTSVNLGHLGIGIRGSTNQLHFCDKVDFDNSSGHIILLLSGIDRFDVFKKKPYNNVNKDPVDDGYSNGDYKHYKWQVLKPIPHDGGPWEPLWTGYANILHSDQFVANETLMSLLNLQTFAQRYNFKLTVVNAFNPFNVEEYIKSNAGSIANKFNWDCYHDDAMIWKLLEADGHENPKDKGFNYYYQLYSQNDWPTKHLTNCFHPTIEGYKIIAKEIHSFL